MEPLVKETLDEDRVWLTPTWNADLNVPAVDTGALQRQLDRLGLLAGVNFFVTFTRDEDGKMTAASVAAKQFDAFRYQRGFPSYNFCILVVLRSKRKNAQTRRYTYSTALRVGRSLRVAGFDDADQARVLREAGHWLMWDNPKPSPQEYAREVGLRVIDELSLSFVTRRR